MMDFKFLDFGPDINNKIHNELSNVICSGFWSTGPQVNKLERVLSSIYGMRAISCSSGGMALEIISKVFSNINKIAIQSNTYFASALPWINSKKDFILIGTKNYSLTPSLEHVKEAIKIGAEAILLTHIGGYPILEIEEIAKYCLANGVLLIEDCAHAPFTKINNKFVGSFGDASILSFFPTKPIPAGEGGIAFFKDISNSLKAIKIRDYGKENVNNKIKHFLPAVSNGRLNEFSASVANTIINSYEEIYTKRKEIADIYSALIPENLIYNISSIASQKLSYYKYITFLKSSNYKVSPVYDKDNQLYSIFHDNNIKFKFIGDNPFGVNHICLPIFHNMTEKQVEIILEGCK